MRRETHWQIAARAKRRSDLIVYTFAGAAFVALAGFITLCLIGTC